MEQKVFNIQLTQSDLQIVVNAIAQRPYSEVVLLLNNLQKQLAEQEKTEE